MLAEQAHLVLLSAVAHVLADFESGAALYHGDGYVKTTNHATPWRAVSQP